MHWEFRGTGLLKLILILLDSWTIPAIALVVVESTVTEAVIIAAAVDTLIVAKAVSIFPRAESWV